MLLGSGLSDALQRSRGLTVGKVAHVEKKTKKYVFKLTVSKCCAFFLGFFTLFSPGDLASNTPGGRGVAFVQQYCQSILGSVVLGTQLS